MTAVRHHAARLYTGTAADRAALDTSMFPVGEGFVESDTGNRYCWNGTDWQELTSGSIRITPEGGFAVLLYNRTGGVTEKGRLVAVDAATDMGVVLTGVNDEECIGAFYEDSIADDALVWVATGGIVEVLLDENTGSTAGNWAQTGTAGYCDGNNAAPVPATHWQEVGHVLETVAAGGAGTWQMAKILMHFN